LNSPARTYLTAICRAIEVRDKHDSHTQILHVKSHTGNRDGPSIGNDQADRVAKEAALDEEMEVRDITHEEYELSHILYIPTRGSEEHDMKWEPIHGNIRKAMNRYNFWAHSQEWAREDKRPRAGEVIRKGGNKVLGLIDEVWKHPTTPKLKFLLHVLNQADMQWPRPRCDRCMENCQDTVRHIFECSSNADIYNEALLEIGKTLHLIDPDDKEDMEDHEDRDGAYGETYNCVTKIAGSLRQAMGQQGGLSSAISNRDIVTAKLVRMAEHVLRDFTRRPSTQQRPEEQEDQLKDHSDLLKICLRVSALPNGYVDGTTERERGPGEDYQPEVGDDVALVATYDWDRTAEHLCFARIRKVFKSSITIEWYEREEESTSDDAWWCLEGQISKVYNLKSVLTTIQWSRRRALRSTSMLSAERRLMPQAERTRMESLYKTALEERSLEGRCEERKRRKVAKTDQKGGNRKPMGAAISRSGPGELRSRETLHTKEQRVRG
jgi:hypothetical protein